MKIWDPIDIAWVAGIIEGEGTFSSTKSSRYMEVSMTDEDTIQKCYDKLQIGHVRGPYFRQGKKSFWVWHVAEAIDLSRLMLAIAPLMSIRRKNQMKGLIDKLLELSINMVYKPCEVCSIPCRPTTRGAKKSKHRYCSYKHMNIVFNRKRGTS